MEKRFTVKDITMIGLLSALVFAASRISFDIPTIVDNTRLHLGNVMCLLSGILLGPVPGGLAAGIGSFFFDLTDARYIKDAPITFLMKFAMAYICGRISHSGGAQGIRTRRNAVAGACGASAYVVLYLTKNFISNVFFSRLEVETALVNMAQKGAASGMNAVLAVVIAVPLATAIRKGLRSYRQSPQH